jgi:hypothetical protein
MRLFHFLSARHGLDDIRRRRLKVSRLEDLNDPFELLGIELSDAGLRKVFLNIKDQMSAANGLLCFSRKWSNPVLWSHYADKHRGVCLGFEVSDCFAKPVEYLPRRLARETLQLVEGSLDKHSVERLLYAKYAHWRYEQEVRCFLSLGDEERDESSGHYFAGFSKEMRLVQAIVGARSNVSRADVGAALGDLAPEVTAFKARLAFKSFSVVRNRMSALWV